jgi:hypothetical protein
MAFFFPGMERRFDPGIHRGNLDAVCRSRETTMPSYSLNAMAVNRRNRPDDPGFAGHARRNCSSSLDFAPQ